MALNVNSTNEEKILVTVSPETAGHKPSSLDGPVRVTVTGGDATFEMVSDTSFWIISSDVPGLTTYLVEGDADLGEGQILLQDSINYTVEGANASSFGLSGAAPVLK